MKQCNKCQKQFEINNFCKNKRFSDGLNPRCKICKKEEAKKHYLKHKRKILDKNKEKNQLRFKKFKEYIYNLKLKGCSKCKENNPCCLEFHHKDPNQKEFDISTAICHRLKGIKTILIEINKCIILCINCHRKITREPIE